MSKKSNAGKFVLAAGIGAALGALGGILFAPKSGKETREDIAKKASEAKKCATEKANNLKKKVSKRKENTED